MSFSISFFARDVPVARSRLQDAYAPAAVKALVELAIAGIPTESLRPPSGAGVYAGASEALPAESAKGPGNRPAAPAPRRLCGILVETHGHIDECGGRSGISLFRVEPYYD